MDWPPQSPDLNPIENLWKTPRERSKARNPKTTEQLWNVLQEEGKTRLSAEVRLHWRPGSDGPPAPGTPEHQSGQGLPSLSLGDHGARAQKGQDRGYSW